MRMALIDWPSYSPKFNPIKHYWVLKSVRLYPESFWFFDKIHEKPSKCSFKSTVRGIRESALRSLILVIVGNYISFLFKDYIKKARVPKLFKLKTKCGLLKKK
jgi:hypothetical protein